MLKVRTLSTQEKDEITNKYDLGPQGMQTILQRTSRVLSEITQYAGVVLVPNPSFQTLKHIEFVPLRENKYLCILVTIDGHIENKIFKIDINIEHQRLESIHNYLNGLLQGLTLDQVRVRVLEELGQEKNRYDQMIAAALRLSQAALEEKPASDVVVSGGANLVNLAKGGDEAEMTRVQELLHALEEKELLVRLLDETMRSERVQVFLGAETAHHAFGDTAVVATPYGPEDQPVGALAVIGPTRMNYGKVLSVVDFTADLITKLLKSE
jgi:heat-inducible transcriptional repressor